MGQRHDLQDLLVGILESENVYFQPPESIRLVYPCVIYERENILPFFSGDRPYLLKNRYLVTVIDRNPDSEIPDKIAALPLCAHNRFFIADNLNHHVFRLFF
jgi:hypothetical protein